MRKKITILTGYPFEEVVIKNRLEPLFAAFRDADWTVELITFATNEPITKVDSQINVPTLPYKINNNKLRLVSEVLNFFILNIYLQLLIYFQKKTTTLVFITTPSMFLIFCMLPKKGNINYVCDIRDITWEYILKNSNRLLPRLLRKSFTLALQRFDYITVTNHSEHDYMLNQGVNEDKVYVLPNGINKDKFSVLESRVTPKKLSSVTQFFYAGNVGKAQNLEFLLDTFSSAAAYANLEISGSGVCLQELQNKCTFQNISNVHFHNFLSWDQMVDRCYSADVLIVSLGTQYKSAVPSKIYEYLTLRKTILYVGPEGACSDFLRDFENVFFVNIDEMNASNTLQSLITDQSWLQDKVSQCGFDRNLEKIKQNFIRDDNCEKFLSKVLSSLI